MQILQYGQVKLLNVFMAKEVAEEVLVDDCYRFDEVPDGAVVLDVGAFYGEFGIRCFVEKRCAVVAYEPSEINFGILQMNLQLNGLRGAYEFPLICAAVTAVDGERHFLHRPEHPAGSTLSQDLREDLVRCVSMRDQVDRARYRWPGRPVFVKMDCEGGEVDIFSDQSRIPLVDRISMEWHNHDGDVFRDILVGRGFDVELEGGGPPPRPKWDKTIGGGLLHARRRT